MTHDFGGAVALRAHLLHGARYRALALVDPAALAPWDSPFFRLAGEHSPVLEQLPPAPHAALVRAHIGTTGGPDPHPAVPERLVEPWLGTAGRPTSHRRIPQADQWHTDKIQGRYSVMVCWGTDDTWIPPEKGREPAAAIPGASFEPVPGKDRLAEADAPAQLIAARHEFLQSATVSRPWDSDAQWPKSAPAPATRGASVPNEHHWDDASAAPSLLRGKPPLTRGTMRGTRGDHIHLRQSLPDTRSATVSPPDGAARPVA
ncbi:hydrolase [Streptomyces mobaraensis NBRC 13819 = DSM 40847]|uniref:Hydrolase n=1 Tax=Streptomyces mobaraensis (strain ATCC 29032 / DSM 40847 / JCM 4168 / NBRC 13819 / NCIMB 11159 / IPCR 16-22) TaxID=1223523 RepID=M3AUX4_STRM1|nr:alpha/beta hydrolase [Streptomyces mobaraensis]EME97392.1 hydrolase [Streptomyces mobaraensis NBRC 13819 = DSM 40847]